MKRVVIIILSVVLLSSCSQEIRDRMSDEGANVSALFLQTLDAELGTYDLKIDSIRFVGVEDGLKLYDVYHHYKNHPVSVGGIVIYPKKVFHTKIDTTNYLVVAFKRNEHNWVECGKSL